MLLQQWKRHKAVLTEPSLRVVWLKRKGYIILYSVFFVFTGNIHWLSRPENVFCALKVIPCAFVSSSLRLTKWAWRGFTRLLPPPAISCCDWLFLELLKPGSPTNHLYVKGQLPTYAPSKAYRIASWGHSKCSPKKPCKTCNAKGKALGHWGAKTQCDQTLKKAR